MATGCAVASPDVRQRPVFHEAIGAWLEELREERGWSLRQAAVIAANRKLKTLTRQVLFRLERGQVKNPDASVLRELAAMYERDYAELAGRFVEANYGAEARQPSSYTGKNQYDLTSPDTGSGLSSPLVEGDPRVAAVVEDRSSESAVVSRYVAQLHSINRLLEIADTLSALSGDVRAIASNPQTQGDRHEASKGAQRDTGLRRAAGRRGTKR
jgi:transcriptional regulator with XRE-family HTH domain